jgi:hypothetical protein
MLGTQRRKKRPKGINDSLETKGLPDNLKKESGLKCTPKPQPERIPGKRCRTLTESAGLFEKEASKPPGASRGLRTNFSNNSRFQWPSRKLADSEEVLREANSTSNLFLTPIILEIQQPERTPNRERFSAKYRRIESKKVFPQGAKQ